MVRTGYKHVAEYTRLHGANQAERQQEKRFSAGRDWAMQLPERDESLLFKLATKDRRGAPEKVPAKMCEIALARKAQNVVVFNAFLRWRK